jgi:hypothetical protein
MIKQQRAQPDIEQMLRNLLDKEKKVSNPSPITKGSQFVGERINQLAQSAPQAFGKFAPIMQNAAQRGSAAVSAANHVLMQQSQEYRQIHKNLTNQEDDSNNGSFANMSRNIQ